MGRSRGAPGLGIRRTSSGDLCSRSRFLLLEASARIPRVLVLFGCAGRLGELELLCGVGIWSLLSAACDPPGSSEPRGTDMPLFLLLFLFRLQIFSSASSLLCMHHPPSYPQLLSDFPSPLQICAPSCCCSSTGSFPSCSPHQLCLPNSFSSPFPLLPVSPRALLFPPRLLLSPSPASHSLSPLP